MDEDKVKRLRYLQLKKKQAEGAASTPATPEEPSLLNKVGQGAIDTANAGLELLAAPMELAGEAIRVPIEQKDGFRAPSIVQRFIPSTRTEEKPSYVVDTVNKLLRGSAGAVDATLKGENPLEGARKSYNADRGTLGVVEDTALGLLTGKMAPNVASAPTEAAFKAFSEGAKAVGKTAKFLGKSAIRVGLGPTFQDQSLLFRRGSEVKGALDLTDLPVKIADDVNKLAVKVNELDDQAWGTLLKIKSEPTSKILNVLKEAKRDFAGHGKANIGDADKKAIAQIDKYIERVQGIKQAGIELDPRMDQMLDQHQLRELVQSVRRDARYDLPDTDPVNRAVQRVAAGIDSHLKENGNYAEIMKELAPATKNLKETASKFALRQENGRYVPTDTTVTKLANATDKKKLATKKVAEEFSRQSGEDLLDQVRLSKAKKSFGIGLSDEELRDNSRGSTRTLLGSVAGMMLEPFIPGQGFSTFGGGLLGRQADIYGGTAAQKIIDLLSKGNSSVSGLLNSTKSRTAGTPLERVLETAFSNPELLPLLKRFGPISAAISSRDR